MVARTDRYIPTSRRKTLKYKRVRTAIKGRLARYPGIGDGCRRRRRQDRLPCTQIAGLDMTIIIQKSLLQSDNKRNRQLLQRCHPIAAIFGDSRG
jgi:hypothetical protein